MVSYVGDQEPKTNRPSGLSEIRTLESRKQLLQITHQHSTGKASHTTPEQASQAQREMSQGQVNGQHSQEVSSAPSTPITGNANHAHSHEGGYNPKDRQQWRPSSAHDKAHGEHTPWKTLLGLEEKWNPTRAIGRVGLGVPVSLQTTAPAGDSQHERSRSRQ